jgi:MFS family permease
MQHSRASTRSNPYLSIYGAALFLALTAAFTVYINSSLLDVFFSNQARNYLYTAGSIGTLIVLILIPKLIRVWGAYRLMLIALTLEIMALFGLSFGTQAVWIGFFFMLHQMLPPVIAYFLDVFLEGEISAEKVTGRIRSNYLTVINLAYLFSPLIVGRIIAASSFSFIYCIAGVFMTMLFVVILKLFKHKKSHPFREIDFADSVRKFHFREGLVKVYAISFLLQCFYALMVIYTSPYLARVIGFDWKVIGTIFTIMLVPFALFEAPLGRIFDAYHREQDAIIAGFIIMSASAASMFLFPSTSFLFWAVMLFLSRTGASFVEMGVEYSFFKRVNDRDAGFISVYRTASPLSYIIAPTIANFLMAAEPSRMVFLAVSLAMLIGVGVGYRLNRLPRMTKV